MLNGLAAISEFICSFTDWDCFRSGVLPFCKCIKGFLNDEFQNWFYIPAEFCQQSKLSKGLKQPWLHEAQMMLLQNELRISYSYEYELVFWPLAQDEGPL